MASLAKIDTNSSCKYGSDYSKHTAVSDLQISFADHSYNLNSKNSSNNSWSNAVSQSGGRVHRISVQSYPGAELQSVSENTVLNNISEHKDGDKDGDNITQRNKNYTIFQTNKGHANSTKCNKTENSKTCRKDASTTPHPAPPVPLAPSPIAEF